MIKFIPYTLGFEIEVLGILGFHYTPKPRKSFFYNVRKMSPDGVNPNIKWEYSFLGLLYINPYQG